MAFNYLNRLSRRALLSAIALALWTNDGLAADGEGWSEVALDSMAFRAEATVARAYGALWRLRERVGIADTARDPRRTGVIGVEWTPITTTLGYENAKELSSLPGWAGWLARELGRRGLWAGAKVALSFSGSFPGLNIAVLAALQEFNADVKGICSVGASSWGANEEALTYPEMERFLREEGILTVGCSAVTFGGTGDRGAEWNDYAREIAMGAVKNSRLPLLMPYNLRDAVLKRMRFYGRPGDYVVFINVGGSQATLGGGSIRRIHRGGWFTEPLALRGEPDGVMDSFLDDGVPVLNLLFLEEINKQERIVHK